MPLKFIQYLKNSKKEQDYTKLNISNKEVRLIEVKYRYKLEPENVLECAKKMHASWNPSYLFVATLGGFYFDEISRIIQSNGFISPLNEISNEIQSDYLQILKDFEKNTPNYKISD